MQQRAAPHRRQLWEGTSLPVRLELSDRAVTVQISGIDRVLACERRIDVPLDQIGCALVQEAGRARVDRPLFCLPGSHGPGLASFGTYRPSSGGDAFWCAYRPAEVPVLRLLGRRYTRLVLQVEDPRALARHINRVRLRLIA